MIITTLDGSLLFFLGWTSDPRYNALTCLRSIIRGTLNLHEQCQFFFYCIYFTCFVTFQRFLYCSIFPQAEVDHLQGLFKKYLESTLNFKKTNCQELIPISELNGVTSLCRLYDSLATPSNGVWQVQFSLLLSLPVLIILCEKTIKFSPSLKVNTSDTENLGRMVTLWFIFSLIWSICASVDEDGRKKIDNFLREMEGTFPIKVLHRVKCLNLYSQSVRQALFLPKIISLTRLGILYITITRAKLFCKNIKKYTSKAIRAIYVNGLQTGKRCFHFCSKKCTEIKVQQLTLKRCLNKIKNLDTMWLDNLYASVMIRWFNCKSLMDWCKHFECTTGIAPIKE